jgi:signal transduction histidine kinase
LSNKSLIDIKGNRLKKEVANIFIFGGLSLLFGFINQIEGGMSNFKEIPLLIHLFYTTHPIAIIFTAIISAFPVNHEISFIDNFLIHFPSLMVAWLFYSFVISRINGHWLKSISWMLVTVIYYCLVLIPIWALLSFNAMGMDYMSTYWTGLTSIKFEMFATILVTGLYLVQQSRRKSLVEYKNNLEQLVIERTDQLEQANYNLKLSNEELLTNSEEITAVNENLDSLVKNRTRKIEEQLKVLNMYADKNSHEVRAPLARMLGLLYLINKEESQTVKNDLLIKVNFCANELDEVIKEMNRLLEKETIQSSEKSESS